MTIRFTVPGVPVPKGRPRVTRHGTYTPKSTVEYEERVRKVFLEQCPKKFIPEGNPIFCAVTAYYPIPKSLSKKQQNALDDKPHIKRGDLDNIVKSVLDALNGKAFHDDGAVCLIAASKRYSERPRTEVTLRIIATEDER